jgi:dethiobiotin synthetase
MSGFFITGTDTGIGKTVTAAAITLALQGYYWKPVQSGVADEMADQEQVRLLSGLGDQHFFPSRYVLQASLSPDQAALREGVNIDLAEIMEQKKSISAAPLIVEGAGGVCVPLNENVCMLDLIQQLGFPVIIVGRGTLGSINHALLTIAALKQREIVIQGMVFSGELNVDNQLAIEKWGGINTLFHLPRLGMMTPPALQQWVVQNGESIKKNVRT